MHNHGRTRTAGSLSRALAVVSPTMAGMGWLAIGIAVGWLVFATPLLQQAINLNSRSAAGTFLGAAAWAVALTAPTCFVVLGVLRLAGAVTRLRGRSGPARPVHAMAGRMPPGVVTLPTIRLPDGRQIPDIVLGPHGIAFFEALPPPAATRNVGGRWEARFDDGRWRPIENPLDRAVRDGDGLRRFLADDDRDFVVKVHPVVVSKAPTLERTDTCAVLALDDVPGWIASLPAQRSLSPERLLHVRDLLSDLV